MNLEFLAGTDDCGRRLDAYLAGNVTGVSRSRVQRLLVDGSVLVNGAPCKDKNYRIQTGDYIAVSVPEPAPLKLQAEPIPLDIVYEDDDLLVINKPRGMVVHPAPGHPGGTLVNALLHHCKDSLSGIGGVARPGIVHRLDRDTTGLLLVAKNDCSHAALSAQLKSRQLRREYIALVHGAVSPSSGRIEAPIGRHPRHRKRMAVVPGGREAVTRYRLIASLGKFSLLRVYLETGRTHQIRVHLSFIGHPVAGDPVYGPANRSSLPPELNRGQALHARRIIFIHPRKDCPMEFSAPLPADFRAALHKIT